MWQGQAEEDGEVSLVLPWNKAQTQSECSMWRFEVRPMTLRAHPAEQQPQHN